MTSSIISSVQVESRALRPVAARLVSYGRSSKMAQSATLYVLRVARGGRQWYVARRFSEFRELHATLKTLLTKPHGRHHHSNHTNQQHKKPRMCAQCRELASAFASLAFPSRFAGFGAAKEKIESQRMQQLNAFVQVLLETTQGLLATQDEDDEYDDDEDAYDDWELEEGEELEDRCDALRVVREFLLVHEHLHDDAKKVSLSQPSTSLGSDTTTTTTTTESSAGRPRLTSSLSISSTSSASNTTTFRVQDLDVMFRPTSPLSTWAAVEIEAVATKAKAVSPLELLPHQHVDELFLADYATPATDAVIHRQLHACEEDGDALPLRTVEAIRRTESLRMSRRH